MLILSTKAFVPGLLIELSVLPFTGLYAVFIAERWAGNGRMEHSCVDLWLEETGACLYSPGERSHHQWKLVASRSEVDLSRHWPISIGVRTSATQKTTMPLILTNKKFLIHLANQTSFIVFTHLKCLYFCTNAKVYKCLH
jgi:hypothetical protein